MRKGYIYALGYDNEKNLYYVGSTVNPKTRLSNHRTNCTGMGLLVKLGIAEFYNNKGINIYILDELEFHERSELWQLENYWIQQMIAWGFPILNYNYKGYNPHAWNMKYNKEYRDWEIENNH